MCLYYHTHSPPTYFNGLQLREKQYHKHLKYNELVTPADRAQRMVQGLINGRPIDAFSTDLPGYESNLQLTIQNDRVLASYNKLADNRIAVPGCPARFSPPKRSLNVGLDMDNDAARVAYPTFTYSLEPLFRSVQCMTPDFDIMGSSDIVTNAGSLYRIFEFLTGTAIDQHRFDIEWQPNADSNRGTLLVQKWYDDPQHNESFGHGNSFTDATCRYPADLPECLHKSFSHHRVLYYEMGGLRFVLHCEVDGFYDPLHQSSPGPSSGKAPTPGKPGRDAETPRTEPGSGTVLTPPGTPTMRLAMQPQPATQSSHISVPRAYRSSHPNRKQAPAHDVTPPSSPGSRISQGSRFSILSLDEEEEEQEEEDDFQNVSSDTLDVTYPCGRIVPADQLVEVKTHNAIRAPKPPEAQLYFAQCKNLYSLCHKSGRFDGSSTRVTNVVDSMKQWEADGKENLARLHAFLQYLRLMVCKSAAGAHAKLSLVTPKQTGTSKEPIMLYTREDGVSFLPAEL